jgi:hypothetical protein
MNSLVKKFVAEHSFAEYSLEKQFIFKQFMFDFILYQHHSKRKRKNK